MKLNEDLFWKRVAEAIDDKGEMPEFKGSDELTIKKLTYENKRLKEKIEDLEDKLSVYSTLHSLFIRKLFRLMCLIDECGHHEIVDMFQDELRDEINKSLEKN